MAKKEELKNYISDVPPEKCFWVNNGPILRNLGDLANTLQEMSDATFQHHVNKEKNDFVNWVGEAIGDKKLSNDLLSSQNKKSALKKVKSRLEYLQKKVK